MRVLWSEASVRRLEAIRGYVARSDPAAAYRLVGKLVALGDSLRRMPHRGRTVPELPEKSLRELIHGNYRLVYRTTPGRVQILTVFEAHRRFPDEDLT